MSKQLWIITMLSYFLVFAVSKAIAAETEMVTQTISEEKLFSDHPPLNFSTSRNAPLINDNSEVLKFKLDYDEQKLVQENKMIKDNEANYPIHRFSIKPQQVYYVTGYSYTGTATAITAKDLTSSSSLPGAQLSYTYMPSDSLFYEFNFNYYSAGTKASNSADNTATTKIIRSADAQQNIYNGFARVNYCWLKYANGFKFCPGVDIIYDSFATLNTRGVSTSPVLAEMQSSSDLAYGINLTGKYAFNNAFNLTTTLGYFTGSNMSRTGVKATKNAATFLNNNLNWKLKGKHSVNFGLNYQDRKASIENSRSAFTDSADITAKSTSFIIGYIYDL